MQCWIIKLFNELVATLSETYAVINWEETIHKVIVLEQINFTNSQLRNSELIQCMQNLRLLTPEKYLGSRLERLLQKWQKRRHFSNTERLPMSETVFEAIITGDDLFFKTRSINSLLYRLENAIDTNFKVIDMSLALNAIELLLQTHIDDPSTIKPKYIKFLRSIHSKTTNMFLSDKLKALASKWSFPE